MHPISVPDFAVRVNGAALPLPARADIESVTVTEDTHGLSMFALTLYNWDQEKLEFTWSDAKLFGLGGDVAIQLGWVGDLHPVLSGEITSLEPTFSADAPPMLTVRGYDYRHRLARGQRTRTFQQVKDSDIVKQVASGAGLRTEATDTRTVLDYVVQHNQSDLDFLQRRARLIGYEIWVREKVLHFRPPQHAAGSVATLAVGRDITEFTPRLRVADQVDEVLVRGWDVKQKRVVLGRSKVGRDATTMGGRSSGPRQASRAFGRAGATTVTVPVRTKARADQMAEGGHDELALSFVQGEVSCGGQPTLRAGSVVDIEGAGTTFSGRYYVTAITHTLAAGEGYRTRLDVRRNAS
jgi:uncharacterized protein